MFMYKLNKILWIELKREMIFENILIKIGSEYSD